MAMRTVLYSVIIVLLIKFVLTENWENVHIICPNQCVCQYSHFMDLSIARWVTTNPTHFSSKPISNNVNDDEDEDLFNSNEATFLSSDKFSHTNTNPLIKISSCMLQAGSEPKDLLNILPQDVQALIILYSGNGINITISTSDLQMLSDLTTLEIRGSKDQSLHLVIDEPLDVENANFESILLIGSEKLKRSKNSKHPSESFNYVPNSERLSYNASTDLKDEIMVGNEFEDTKDIEILPYDVYLMEKQKSEIASFYGWEHLSTLRIHNCNLNELYWEMFDGLRHLQYLSLEHNDLKVIPAFAFYGAFHIKKLSLAHNFILDFNYRALAGLLDLEILDLSHNNLTKLSELTFPPFPKLEYVDFRWNPIRYIFSATFGVMNNTRTMLLGSDKAELELPTRDIFDSLDLLKKLSIFNVNSPIIDQNTFKGLRGLEVLTLKGSINKIEFDAFTDMPHLRELDLSNLQLQDVSMDAFIGCRNLKIINLSNNNISYIPPGLFDDQISIQEIYLNGNQIRFLPTNFFNKPTLKLARLNDNPWKCTCDMTIWKPHITNQYRGVNQERCIRDFHSGKTISCRQLDNYKFDNKLSPRCANIKGRSVYYALRKNLQCDFKKELEQYKKYEQNRKFIKPINNNSHINYINNKYKSLEKKLISGRIENSMAINSVLRNSDDEFIMSRREEYQPNRVKKLRKTPRKMNSLRYLSQTNNQINNNASKGESDILGSVDNSDSFNFI